MADPLDTPGGAGSSSGEPPPTATQWSGLLRQLPAPVYLCDVHGYLTDCNQAAIELWGRAPRLGQDRWDGAYMLYQADGQPLAPEQSPMAHAIRRGTAIRDAEIIIERPDGSRRVVRVNPAPLYDETGQVCGAVNQLLDATAFKLADHARARLAAIVDSSDDAIISKDLNGIIQTWNAGAERLFGYSAEQAIGRSITMLIPPDRLEEEPRVLARIRNGEVVDHFETLRRHRDGGTLHISLTLSPIHDGNGRIIGASKIARDIGEQVRTRRALLDADRKKDEFIATMAHELRNPLAPLKTSLHLIEMTGYDGYVPRSTLEMMQRQVNHLTRLVEDLLDLSRLSHGQIELKRESLAIGDVVSDAIDIAGPRIEAKGHRLELALPRGLRVQADRTRLVQVLANLLNNACKFTPAPGLVRLQVERDGDSVRIGVIDNGIGIAAEDQQKVFGMFERVNRGPGAESGMGIGLSLVQHLVALHGGTIRLVSAGPGQGSAFTVTLPLDLAARDTAPAARPASPQPAAAAGRRILVVDDNVDAAAALDMLFRTLGHSVALAHCGEDALSLGAGFLPDTVLLDIGLPDLPGTEVAARMRQTPWGRAATLVALTGWGTPGDRRETAAAGFDHHLVKPVDLDVLERLLAGAPPTRG